MAVAADAIPVAPDRDTVRRLAAEHALVPLRHTYIADTETPVSAFLKLRALEPGQPAFLLESAEQGQRVGRWSFMGWRPREVIRWSLGDGGDPYALVADAVARYRQAGGPDLPPFAGGAVGFFAYDLVRTVEPLEAPNPDPVGLPDMALMLSDLLVAFDHLKHTVTVLAHVHADAPEGLEASYAAAVESIAEVRAALAGLVPAAPSAGARPEPSFESNMPRSEFEAMVARIVE